MEHATEEKKPIRKGRSPSFSKTYATNVLVSETDSDVRLYGFNEIINDDKEGQIAISDGELILTNSAVVLLSEQLNNLIKKWDEADKKVEVSENRRATLNALLNGF